MSKPETPRPIPESPSPAAWLSTGEAARHLGLTPKTLANMRSLGTGPCFHKLGSKVWYLGEDLITYRRRHRYIASGERDES